MLQSINIVFTSYAFIDRHCYYYYVLKEKPAWLKNRKMHVDFTRVVIAVNVHCIVGCVK